jgi:protein-disulfide isomerase
MKFRKTLLLMTLLVLLALATTACASPQKDGRIVRGNSAAPLTIVEFTDFQCPYCANGARTVSAMMAKYEGKVKLVVKHYPLPFHPAALPAALYFEGIAVQSPEKAWQFYDALFADPRQLSDGEDALKKVAAELGVDMKKLEQDARNPETYKKIAADKQEFEQAQFDGVPVFVINGTALVGAQPPQKFIEVIDAALKK